MIRGGGGSVLDMELTADGRLLALAVGCWLLVAGCINMTSQKLVKDTQSHSQFKIKEVEFFSEIHRFFFYFSFAITTITNYEIIYMPCLLSLISILTWE